MRTLCLAGACLIIVGLFALGSLPGAGRLFLPPWDKVAHVSVYASLALLLWFGTGARAPLFVAAAVIAVGALDELHQAGLPGRTADLADLAADACGIALAFFLLRSRKLATKGKP